MDLSDAGMVSGGLDNTMGAFYIGVLLGGALFGVVTFQGFSYYRSRSWADPVAMRLLVTAIWCLSCAHQIFVSHAVYRYLISNFLGFEHLNRILWTAVMEVTVTGIIAMCVHGFYITRIFHMSNRNVAVTAILSVATAAEFVIAAIFSAKAVRVGSFLGIDRVKHWFVAVNTTFTAVSFLVTAVYFYLVHSQQKSKFKPSNKEPIARVAAYCVDTGLLACFVALASLIAFLAASDTFIFAPFLFCIGRLHAISFLSTLNGTGPKRPKPKSGTSSDVGEVYGGRPQTLRMHSMNVNRIRPTVRDVSVHIDTVQYVNRDDDYDVSSDQEKMSPDVDTKPRVV